MSTCVRLVTASFLPRPRLLRPIVRRDEYLHGCWFSLDGIFIYLLLTTLGRLRIAYLKRVAASSGVIDSRADKSRSMMIFQYGARPADRVICSSALLSPPSSARLLQRWARASSALSASMARRRFTFQPDGDPLNELGPCGQCVKDSRRFAATLRAWPSAWPSPSGPRDRQWSPPLDAGGAPRGPPDTERAIPECGLRRLSLS